MCFPVWRKGVGLITAVLVFGVAGAGGWLYLRDDAIKVRPDATPDDYSVVPAMLWATGHGLSFTMDPLKQCEPFLMQQQDQLDPSAIPADVKCFPAGSKFVYDRANLHYMVGIVWRLFGVSWSNLKGLLAVIFAIVAVLTYGIFRLGMNRGLSLVGTVLAMTSPVMLREAAWLRSICKAPFILASILIVGYILTTQLRPRALLFLALLTGLVIGTGLGFRQDPIICLPPALVAVAVGARIGAKHHLWYRLLACLLMIAAFTASAWPSLRMTRDTGGNNAFYLAQGFAATYFETANLTPPFYTFASGADDYLVHGLISDYAKKQRSLVIDDYSSVSAMGLARFVAMLQCAPSRVISAPAETFIVSRTNDLGFWTHKAELIARRLVMDLYETFPGDAITRWYGAVLRVVRGLQVSKSAEENTEAFQTVLYLHRPLAEHLDYYGHWYAIAAIVVISSQSPWLALCILTLLLYFCGYTSLGFQVRHAFHLSFLAIWFPLFLLSMAGRGARQALRAGTGERAWNVRKWLPYAGRMTAFGAVAFFALAAPLYAARLYQHGRVHEIHDRYVRADLEPLPFKMLERDGHTVCMPDAFPAFQESILDKAHEYLASLTIPSVTEPIVRSEYVVLEMEVQGATIDLSYQRSRVVFPYCAPKTSKDATVRLFVPVFRYADSYAARETSAVSFMFDGFNLEPGVNVKNVYRVRNAKDFPILLTVCMSNDMEETGWCYTLPRLVPWSG